MDGLLIDAEEARRMLGISRTTFYTLVGAGRIPRIKIGRCARYRRSDIVTFTEQLAAEAGAQHRWTCGPGKPGQRS